MLKLNKKHICFILLGILVSCTKNTDISHKQAKIFVKYFGGSSNDSATSLALCADGGYALTGQISPSANVPRAFFIRTDQYGNELSFSPIIIGNGKTSTGYNICQTKDGGFLLVGSVIITGRSDKDFLLVKIKPDGLTDWQKIWGSGQDDEGFSVSETAEGNILVGGYSNSVANHGKDAYGALIDNTGTRIIWEKNYGFDSDEVCNSFVEKDTYFLLIGYTDSYQSANLNRSVFLVKVDKVSGNPVDSRYFGGANDEAGVKSANDADGNIYILANSTASAVSSIYILKLDINFQLIWEKYLSSTNSETGKDIMLNNNQVVIIGSSSSQSSDFLIDVLDTDGNLVNPNSNTIQALGDQYGQAGAIGTDGRIIIAGSDNVGGFSKVALIKTDLPK